MKHLVVLYDLSTACNTALKYANEIGSGNQVKITLLHINEKTSKENENVEASMKNLADPFLLDEVTYEFLSKKGNFFATVALRLDELQPDLVLVATHGVVGLKQNLFGSNILKLAKKLHFPVLVVQEFSEINKQKLRKLLIPLSPHNNFMLKCKQTAELSRMLGASIQMLGIRKTDGELPEELKSNMLKGREYFEVEDIACDYIEQEAQAWSMGYTNEILRVAKENGTGMVSIISEVSETNRFFGNADKEALLVNKDQLPVLCCN